MASNSHWTLRGSTIAQRRRPHSVYEQRTHSFITVTDPSLPMPAEKTEQLDNNLEVEIDEKLQSAKVKSNNQSHMPKKMSLPQTLSPATFHGKPGENPSAWLKIFNSFCAYQDMDKDHKLNAFKILLRDTAAAWLDTVDSVTSLDWGKLEKAFSIRFGTPECLKWTKVVDLFDTPQSDSQTVREYIEQMIRDGKQHGVPDMQIFQAVMKGLHPSCNGFIAHKDPKTLQELLDASDLAQAARRMNKPDTSVVAAIAELTSQVKLLSANQAEVMSAMQDRSRTPTRRVSFSDDRYRRSTSYDRDGRIRSLSRERSPHHRRDDWKDRQREPSRDHQRYQYRSGKYSRPSYSQKHGVICNNCRKIGHFARNCWAAKKK